LKGFITDDVSSHVRIEGLININDEYKRIDKRKAELENLIGKLKGKMNGKMYMTKVPE
jgi:valyl-tRNA synthetase